MASCNVSGMGIPSSDQAKVILAGGAIIAAFVNPQGFVETLGDKADGLTAGVSNVLTSGADADDQPVTVPESTLLAPVVTFQPAPGGYAISWADVQPGDYAVGCPASLDPQSVRRANAEQVAAAGCQWMRPAVAPAPAATAPAVFPQTGEPSTPATAPASSASSNEGTNWLRWAGFLAVAGVAVWQTLAGRKARKAALPTARTMAPADGVEMVTANFPLDGQPTTGDLQPNPRPANGPVSAGIEPEDDVEEIVVESDHDDSGLADDVDRLIGFGS